MRCASQPLLRVAAPGEGAVVRGCEVEVRVVALGTSEPETLRAELNGAPIALAPAGRGGRARAGRVSGAPLRAGANTLVARVEGKSGGSSVQTVGFRFEPDEPRARRIEDERDLVRGPLAHGKPGDWLLENCSARFVIQDGGRRDLHSIGQYGGNLIDAELRARPGRDQFFELQPALNVETVQNAQHVEIVNDGRNGEAAVIRACGPDDLLDYINPSALAAGLGFVFPPLADDHDLPIEACTEYLLEPGATSLRIETFVMNPDPEPVALYVGDYVNGMGALEQWTPPSAGVGEIPITLPRATAQSWFGFGAAEGVDYALVPLEIEDRPQPFETSSFTTAGVTFVAQSHSIILITLGLPPNFIVPGAADGEPGVNSFVRFFGVGEGSPSNAVELRAEALGLPTGEIAGCVRVGGRPAPGARVAVGPLDRSGRIARLATLFVSDASGCYRGALEPGDYAAAASLEGTPYEDGGPEPPLRSVHVAAGERSGVDFELPTTGRLRVLARDEAERPLPARITVVGFDPSPEPVIEASTGLGDVATGLFRDLSKDGLPFGIARVAWAGADGRVELDLEPGTYRLFVSRGTEYSAYDREITARAGEVSEVVARIARVVDTEGFISSDYHVHMLASPDSRIGLVERVLSFAAEGVDNIITTDHDAHTDLLPTIEELGLADWVHATVGEEITTFDYGHFNAYPQDVDPDRPSGGSTDWAGAAPPGEDFPALGNFSLAPARIEAAALENPRNAGLGTVVQINHIDSHFEPLAIDTSLPDGPRSLLSDAEKASLRLCSLEVPGSCDALGRVFHPFRALELWNGASSGAQRAFLRDRIGIWMNLLHHGFPTTAIADTDTHTLHNLAQAGAATWTPSRSDEPRHLDPREIGDAVRAGRAVGGQGLYVQARLRAAKGRRNLADFTGRGSTTLAARKRAVDLEITVQAPLWAEYDTIEIYQNATTCVSRRRGGVPVLYSALPSRTLVAGGADAGGEFRVVEVEDVPGLPGAGHRETRRSVRLETPEDAFVVVVARGTPGVSRPMFPIFPRDVSASSNATLEDLLDGNLGEGGVLALGFTNALYVDVDGGGFDPPGPPPVLAACP
jgi:hypothetical protein